MTCSDLDDHDEIHECSFWFSKEEYPSLKIQSFVVTKVLSYKMYECFYIVTDSDTINQKIGCFSEQTILHYYNQL